MKQEHDSETIGDFICWRYQRYSLYELKCWLGETVFNKFLEDFSGCYIKLPSGESIRKILDDYQLAIAVKIIADCRKQKKKDYQKWSEAELLISKICSKRKKTNRWGQSRGKDVLKEIDKIKKWKSEIDIWSKKFLKSKHKME